MRGERILVQIPKTWADGEGTMAGLAVALIARRAPFGPKRPLIRVN